MAGDSRKLGETERLLHYLHGFRGLITLMVLHLEGEVATPALARALRWLQSRHPMLRAHVRYGAPVFIALPPFVYRQPWLDTDGTTEVPLTESTLPWRDAMSAELATPIRKGRNPRLRVSVVRTPGDPMTRIMITADHGMIDARSCNMLARELLEHLAEPARMEAQPAKYTKLPPAVEASLPPKSGDGKTFEPALRLPDRPVGDGPTITAVHQMQLPPEQLQTIKLWARSRGATLHGVLTAAFLHAMRDSSGVVEMTALTTFDLRKATKPPLPADTFGCYIDILRTKHIIRQDLFATARDVSFRLVSVFAKDHASASILKTPGWEVYRKEFQPMMAHRRRLDGLGITTAADSGLRTRYGRLTLSDVTMAVSLDEFGTSTMAICCERGGALDISLCYATRAMSQADAEDLAARALRYLMAIAPDQPAAKPALEPAAG